MKHNLKVCVCHVAILLKGTHVFVYLEQKQKKTSTIQCYLEIESCGLGYQQEESGTYSS